MWIHLLTLGLINGASEVGAQPPVVVSTPGGVRRVRFLRRAPRLPWDQDEIETVVEDRPVSIAKSIRKRIRLPAKVVNAIEDDVPIATERIIDAPSIRVPELGTAKLHISTDEEEALLMAIIQ